MSASALLPPRSPITAQGNPVGEADFAIVRDCFLQATATVNFELVVQRAWTTNGAGQTASTPLLPYRPERLDNPLQSRAHDGCPNELPAGLS
jgi:hypothetical protein